MYCKIYRSDGFFTGVILAAVLYSFSLSIITQTNVAQARNNIERYPITKVYTEINAPKQKTDQAITISSNTNEKASSNIPDENKKDLLSSLSVETVLATIPLSTSIIMNHQPAFTEQMWEQQISEKYKNAQVRTIKKGIKHISLIRYTNDGRTRINIVEVSRELNNNIYVQPALSSSSLRTKNSVDRIAHNYKSVVAINGGFFNPRTGHPLGLIKINDEIITGPVFDRVALGIGDGFFEMDQVKMLSNLKINGQDIKIDNINQARMSSAYTLAYNNKWGKWSPVSQSNGIQVVIQDNKVTAISANQQSIPQNGYVVVGLKSKLKNIKVGDTAQVDISIDKEWRNVKHIISGGPFLVKNGEVYVDTKAENLNSIGGKNPRSAIGYTKDGTLVIVAVDGRAKGSAGVSLWTLAKIMKDYGCINAMNLDGGGSTQLYVNKRVVNTPSEKYGRYVSNAIIVNVKDN